jgi:DNA-directed RNA polymerase subunit RPC12/RpoP
MPPTRPPSAGRATLLPRPALTPTRISPAGLRASPAHRIMVAGVDKDARGAVEASVRQALLGSPEDSGPWSVSVVSLAGKWSVTLDSDRLRGVSEARDPHVCEYCGKAVLVVYERQPDEPKELAPLACPHCWRIGHVPVGLWAAAGRDYRAEKA